MLTTQDFSDKAVDASATKATYGEKIKALRMAEGMSRSELAKRISLSDRSIRFIETGDRKPGEYTLKKIAYVFGVTMDYFKDITISRKDLDDTCRFEKIHKKYEINNAMRVTEIIEEITDLVENGDLSKTEKDDLAEQMERLLLRMRIGSQKK